ncbi:MAG: XRE family transcriptional regulator [Deltaproteobacteria bacterium]|nr:XRE family transcriptional regulator [Deltaproteobacteria bacterium]MBW2390794.1 XRE family transcriptional regulator [Deltaproteobacteria bacterium]
MTKKINKKSKTANPHRGSSLDEFLAEEGILEEATARAAKKALAWQFAQAMKEQNVTKAALARRMKTSRAQLDRLLDPENQSVTLKTLARAAEILGMRVRIELLDA